MPEYVKVYLEKIEELCEKNNAQLLLVSMPSPKNWNHKRHAEIQKYADGKGITYLDLNKKVEELGLNWKIIEMIRCMKHGISWPNSISRTLQEYKEK